MPSVLYTRSCSYAISGFRHHRRTLQSRYLLTGTGSSHDFLTERLQVPRRCARPSSDRFFIVTSPYGWSFSSTVVDTERHLFLLTQQHTPARGRCPDARALCIVLALSGCASWINSSSHQSKVKKIMETSGKITSQNEGDIGIAQSTKKERTRGHFTAKTHKSVWYYPYIFVLLTD